VKQNGRWAGGQTFPPPSLGPLYPKVQRDAVERGVDPPKAERSTMTTYDLKQTGQLNEARHPAVCAWLSLLGMRRGHRWPPELIPKSPRNGWDIAGSESPWTLYGHVMPGMQEDAAAQAAAGPSGRKKYRQVNGSKSLPEVLLSY
jgi:hypothetical protein